MATWQFDFYLIARKRLRALFGEVPSTLSDKAFNLVERWADARLPEDYDAVLSAFLPKRTSWSATTTMWGEENGDRIEISIEAGSVNYIFARIDVSKRNDQFLEGIVGFAQYVDAVLFTVEKGLLIEPSVEALVEQVEASNAFKFVQDPQDFFERIRKGEIKIRGFGEGAT